MKIAIKDLPSHLNQRLAASYFIIGDEPLQQKEAIDLIRFEAKKQGFLERESFDIHPQFQWEILFNAISSPSLFADKRLIECRLISDKINTDIAAGLTKLASLLPTDTTFFLISAPKIDYNLRQSKWFSTFDTKGVILKAEPLSQNEMILWLKQRAATLQFSLSSEALDLLLQRTEGNLFAAAQTLEKLHLCGAKNPLTAEDILTTVGQETRFGLFDLIDAILSKEASRVSQIFYRVKQENIDPILIVWAIAREVRTAIGICQKMQKGVSISAACTEFRVWKQRESIVKSWINRIPYPVFLKALTHLKQIDDIIKGRELGHVWDRLFSICLILTQQKISQEILL